MPISQDWRIRKDLLLDRSTEHDVSGSAYGRSQPLRHSKSGRGGAYDPLLREIGSTQENQPIFLRTLATKMVFDKNI